MTFELKPIDGRKSFYGKCYVYQGAGEIVLYSYKTRIMAYNPKNKTIRRVWFGFSATTQRHINSFLEFVGRPELKGKSNFVAMDRDRVY